MLFHGLTNCPQQFDAFAQLLHARGHTVYVPRLPHHGHRDRHTKTIGALTVGEIGGAAVRAAALGGGLAERTNVLGISLGGTMALWLAQAGGVDGAVALAPFLMLPFVPRRPGLLLMQLLATLPDRFVWWDPRRKDAWEPPYAYPGFWTHALAQTAFAGYAVFAAARTVAPAAPSCTVIVNAHDPAVNNGPARELAGIWQRRGAPYRLAVWDDLGREHDVIDPTTYAAAATLVYPRLAALLEA